MTCTSCEQFAEIVKLAVTPPKRSGVIPIAAAFLLAGLILGYVAATKGPLARALPARAARP